jgi:2'-5' RNA ligase
MEEPVRIAAADVAGRLRARLDGDLHLNPRWVPAENLHITLWFIGEVDEERAAVLLSSLQHPFRTGPFDLHLAGLGAFPRSGAPRVLWLGVREGQDGLRALHAEVGARLRPFGFEAERRLYSGHVTLARVKDAPRRSAGAVREALAGTPADAGHTRVSAVTVFRSRVSSAGSRYEPLARVPLVAP